MKRSDVNVHNNVVLVKKDIQEQETNYFRINNFIS